MSDEMVILQYGSPTNISMRGTVETGCTVAEWNGMSEKERDELLSSIVFEQLIELSPITEGANW